MAEIERMTIVFTEPMAGEIRAAVEAGEYATTSEAVRDAVRLWSGRKQLRHQQLELWREAWDAGKASGVHGPLDMAAILREARAELRAEAAVEYAGAVEAGAAFARSDD